MPALSTKGFNVINSIPASNIYPDKFSPLEEPFDELLSAASCDQWNTKLSRNLAPRKYDEEVFQGAVQQQEKGLLSRFFSKQEMDDHFGPGLWRGLRRRGIWQGQIRKDGSRKIRGIDNARSSKHNAAAFLTDTIMTTAPDIDAADHVVG